MEQSIDLKPHYQRTTDDRVSPIDPDAAPMQPSGGGSAVLGYRDHYVVDGGKARIILSALVAPASITDNMPILDLLDWICSRWRIEPKFEAMRKRNVWVEPLCGEAKEFHQK